MFRFRASCLSVGLLFVVSGTIKLRACTVTGRGIQLTAGMPEFLDVVVVGAAVTLAVHVCEWNENVYSTMYENNVLK